MDPQKIFDTVARHLLTQGKRSVTSSIAALIGKRSLIGKRRGAVLVRQLLVRQLQHVHDSGDTRLWKLDLAYYARLFTLNADVLLEFPEYPNASSPLTLSTPANPPDLDRYDHAVAYLTAAPHEICEAWDCKPDHPASCLFSPAAANTSDYSFGCLTQIASGHRLAETAELTALIRSDTRIPKLPQSITAADLPVFAGWQRRLDTYFERPLAAK